MIIEIIFVLFAALLMAIIVFTISALIIQIGILIANIKEKRKQDK